MTNIEKDVKMLRAKHDQNPLSFGMSNTESFEIWKALVICEAVEAINKDLQGGERER